MISQTAAVKKIPDLAFSAVGAAWRWYWKLGLLGMFFTTVIVGALFITVIPSLPLPAGVRSSIRGDAVAVTIVAALLALLIGMIRGGVDADVAPRLNETTIGRTT